MTTLGTMIGPKYRQPLAILPVEKLARRWGPELRVCPKHNFRGMGSDGR